MPQKKAVPRICADCGQLKRLYAYGLCRQCYVKKRWRKTHLLTPRKCKNCHKWFKPKKTNLQLFCSDKCKSQWDNKEDRKKHPISKIFLGSRICECGKRAYIELLIRPSATKGLRGRFRFFHKVWDKKKYKKARKKLSSYKARNLGWKTKTCYYTKTFEVYRI